MTFGIVLSGVQILKYQMHNGMSDETTAATISLVGYPRG